MSKLKMIDSSYFELGQTVDEDWNSLSKFQTEYNYLITKQSAKLNKNYYTRKSEVNIHKSHEDKSINLSLGELP